MEVYANMNCKEVNLKNGDIKEIQINTDGKTIGGPGEFNSCKMVILKYFS
jgi:hypothetical protein